MNFNLTEEQKLIKKTASEFANDELLEGVIKRDQKKIWPSNQISKMADLGFLGMMIDEKWGGSGLDSISYCIVMEEISTFEKTLQCKVFFAVIRSLTGSLF